MSAPLVTSLAPSVELPNTMEVDQNLVYQTYFLKTDYESPALISRINTTQNITVENDQTLTISEQLYNSFWSYQIFPDNSTPQNTSETFPIQYTDGGWAHNYPVNEEALSVNAIEINYYIPCGTGRVMDLDFDSTEELTFDALSISTSVFKGSMAFSDDVGSS